MKPTLSWTLSFLFLALTTVACAGPPFTTDDPEPVGYGHWEIFFATSYFRTPAGETGAFPALDINYGILPEVHLNCVAPFAFNGPTGATGAYGYGDTELALKIRLRQETPDTPQMAFYPRLLLPTGDSARGLGEGIFQLALPLWFQKSWGPWTTYGGASYWFHSGETRQDWVYAGWEVQRDLGTVATLGAEVFFRSAAQQGADANAGFNVGATVDLDSIDHLLYSMGRDFTPNGNNLTIYFAFQWTLPGE